MLLSITILKDLRIHLSLWNQQWWFEVSSILHLNPHQFTKSCRNYAYIFAVVKLPEDIWLPMDPDETPRDSEGIPTELRDFHDVFSAQRSKMLPSQKSIVHAIDLKDGEAPPYGPIYPLSQTEIAELRRYINENIANRRI
jgi:hypothetical protein